MSEQEFLRLQERFQSGCWAAPGSLERDAFLLLCEVRRQRLVFWEIVQAQGAYNQWGLPEAAQALDKTHEICMKELRFENT
jgi:hypothetical protein